MKKFILLFCAFFLFSAYGIEEFKSVGIAKYAVLETTQNYAPLRDKPNENAKRISELPQGCVLFATEESENYFLVELNEKNRYFINKKHAELQAVIPEKRLEGLDEIEFLEKRDRFIVNLKTQRSIPFSILEEDKNLKISFYDIHFDPTNSKIENDLNNFSLTDKIANEFEIKYYNKEPQKPFFGYDIQKNEVGYKIIIKKAPKVNQKRPLEGKKVLVDAGHGGRDFGVCANNLKEKKINLQISKKLKNELQKRGAKVYLTRKNDQFIPLYDRADFAKEKDVDISISIHQNSLPDRSKVVYKHGTGTYYYQNQAKPLAQSIQKHMLHDTKFQDDKVNHASFVMTRMTLPVSVLVECGYLICPEEAKCLKNRKFQKIVAKAIAKGTAQYLKDNF